MTPCAVELQRDTLSSERTPLLAELPPHRLGRIADASDDGCKTFLRYSEFLGPIANFVILIHADACAILSASKFQALGHLYLP